MEPSRSKVLLIEDSPVVSKLVRTKIKKVFDGKIDTATSLAEAREKITANEGDYFVAIVDLGLPDSKDNESAALTISHKIPTVVFSGRYSETDHEHIREMGAIDYVNKESITGTEYLAQLVVRLHKNRETKVLLVDDSAVQRRILSGFLKNHWFKVLMARDGVEALEILEKEPDIRLAIVDYEMPRMNGFSLITQLRLRRTAEELAIVGMSASEFDDLAVTFIKYGADDFVLKPIKEPEFMVRVNACLRKIDLLTALRVEATTDHLTGLYNRRHFFSTANHLYAAASRGHLTLALGMIDIDFFKKINDTYGHECGDEVLRVFSRLLQERARKTDVVARFGGEEFCFLAVSSEGEGVDLSLFENIREMIEKTEIPYEGEIIKVTASLGVTAKLGDKIDGMLKAADEALYDAKENGRNRVVIAD